MATPHERTDQVHGGFPGGRVKLPRLSRPRNGLTEDREDGAAGADRCAAATDGTDRTDRTDRTDPTDATDTSDATDLSERGAIRTQRSRADDAGDEVEGTFADYFSVESLFGESPEPGVRLSGGLDVYAALGLPRTASWKEVCRAHREMVSLLHPDRYVDADEETREAAERRVRDVNEAYAEIRRQRSVDRS